MTEFILVWILVTTNGNSIVSYSPPVRKLADCQRLQAFVKDRAWSHQCIQVDVPRGNR